MIKRLINVQEWWRYLLWGLIKLLVTRLIERLIHVQEWWRYLRGKSDEGIWKIDPCARVMKVFGKLIHVQEWWRCLLWGLIKLFVRRWLRGWSMCKGDEGIWETKVMKVFEKLIYVQEWWRYLKDWSTCKSDEGIFFEGSLSYLLGGDWEVDSRAWVMKMFERLIHVQEWWRYLLWGLIELLVRRWLEVYLHTMVIICM